MVDTKPLTGDTGTHQWGAQLFECFNNPLMCLFSVFVPCGQACMQAVNAKTMFKNDEPNQWILAFFMNWLLCCCGAAYNRQKLRSKFDIRGNYILDCILQWFLCCCAVNQEWRQVMNNYHSDENMSICTALNSKGQIRSWKEK